MPTFILFYMERGWLTSINLQKWSLATWQEVWHLCFHEKLTFFLAYGLWINHFISFLLLQQCVYIQHCSWDLHGWYSHVTIYFLHVMLQMRLFSSINIPDGQGQKGKWLTCKQNKTFFQPVLFAATLRDNNVSCFINAILTCNMFIISIAIYF